MVKGKDNGLVKKIVRQQNSKQRIVLKRGDVIKLGRAVLRVSDLRFGGEFESTGDYEGPYQDNRMDFTTTKVIPE